MLELDHQLVLRTGARARLRHRSGVSFMAHNRHFELLSPAGNDRGGTLSSTLSQGGPYFTGSVRKRSLEDFSAGSSITATEVCCPSNNCRRVAIPLVTSSANFGAT